MRKKVWEMVVRPVIVAAMFGTVAVSLVHLAGFFFPEWNGTYLVVAVIVVSLEASYSRRLLQAAGLRGAERFYFRLTELLTLFILLKAGTYVGLSWRAIITEIRAWPHNPLLIFDLEVLLGFILILIVWDLTNQTMDELARINERPVLRSTYVHPRQRLAERFFTGGILLLLLAGLTHVGLSEVLRLNRPAMPGIVFNVLLYFLLGLLLLGQTHYDTLRRRWQLEEMTVASELPRRWLVYSLALIGVGALLAAVLPTSQTVGLFELLDVLVSALAMVIFILWYILFVLFLLLMLPFYWVFSLFTSNDLRPPDGPPPVPPAVRNALEAGAGPAWFEVLRSLLFWALLLGGTGYILRSYLADHPELRHAVTQVRALHVLGQLLTRLRRWLGGWREAVTHRLPERLQFHRTRPASLRHPFKLFRLGSLSPAERVRYYYLSILRRAGRQGYPRRDSQTPYEYEETLRPALLDDRDDLEALTDAFVEARYSRHELTTDELHDIADVWKRVRTAIRRLNRNTGA